MDPLLSVQDLKVFYRSQDQRRVALDGVKLTVVPNESIGLLGESGCGKTTLGLALMNVLPSAAHVERGVVFFRGTNLLDLPESELQKLRGAQIAMVHQEPGRALNPVLRVGRQIAEVLRAHQSISRQRAIEESKSLLIEMGFDPESRVWEAFPHQLSGGQQQRVAIAQAVACHPLLLIADEPTTALDSVAEQEILELLGRLRRTAGMAVILISHDPRLLAGFADRVLVMYAGRVVEDGPADTVLRYPRHPYTEALLRCETAGLAANHKKILPTIPGESPDPAHLPFGCSFEPRCPDRMERCRSCPPSDFPIKTQHAAACFKYAS